MLMTLIVQLISAAIFLAVDPEHNYATWLYHCCTPLGLGPWSFALAL